MQGVFVTLEASAAGANTLKRVRFARGRFSKEQAEAWWQAHKHDVAQRCNLSTLRPAEADSPQHGTSTPRCGRLHSSH